jgi:hypothetical protein
VIALLVLLQAPELAKWELARERVGHRVVADAVLARPAADDLKIVALFFDRDLELKRSKLLAVPRGQTAFKIEVEQLPNFSRFELYVQAGATTWVYLGADLAKPPVLKKADPARAAVVDSKDLGEGKLTLVVHNTGGSEAAEPTAVVAFRDAAGKDVHRGCVRLGDVLRASVEETFEIAVPGVGGYVSTSVALVWRAAEGPSQKDPKDVAEVAVRRFRTSRFTDGSVRLDGEIRNGSAAPVEKVVATFKLGKTAVPVALAGALKPGDVRPFEVWVPGAPAFDAAGYDLSFSDAKAAADAPAAPGATATRTGSKELAPSGPSLPAAAPEKAAAQDEKPGVMKAELRGLMVVEGITTPKSGKYTGDVYFLRVAFTDAAGKPAKPAASFQIAVLEAGRDPWKVQRIVTKDTWKVDAAKLTAQTADPAVMAWDKKTDEIWLGLVRTDGAKFSATLEISLTVKEQGAWVWKGVADKYEAAARGPDKPAK